MNLSKINKTFWEYFKQCPRRSCLNFSKNHKMFNNSINTYKKITVDQQRYYILEKIYKKFFSILILEKQVDMKELKKYMLALISKKIFEIKNHTKYDKTYKKEAIDLLNSLKDFEDLNNILSIFKQEDAIDLNFGGIYEMDISEYLNNNYGKTHIKSIKNEFHYSLDIPFYKKDLNGITIIKFTNDIIFQELDNDLIITKAFFERSTEEKLYKIILYNLKDIERIEITDMNINMTHIYNIIKIIDSEYEYANSGPYCNKCDYIDLCKIGIKKSFKEILDEKKEKEL